MATPTEELVGRERVHRLVQEWRTFAASLQVTWRGHERSWTEHIAGDGFEDETGLIQPIVFPAFAQKFLGWEVGTNLSPEQTGEEGKPDFTPADPVTHPFVFETKGTRRGASLANEHDLAQVRRYLTDGRPRIKRVVLTNISGLRIFELDENEELRDLYAVAEAARRYLGAFEEYAYEVERLSDLGSGSILAVVTERGRGKSSGVPVRRSFATLYTVIDDKIARITVFPSEEQALEAAGLSE